MKLLSSLLFMLACSISPKTALAHYEVLNPNTTLTELTFEMVHRYLGSSHENSHRNTCKLAAGKTTLQSCKLAYEFFLATSNILVKTEYIDLRGDGSYDGELVNASSHYNSLRVAEAHGVDFSQHVSIPYADISTLSGSDGLFRVETYSEGVSCVGASNCLTDTDGKIGGYTRHNINLTQENLDVACEIISTSLGGGSLESTLSGEHIYLHNSNASRLSQSIGSIGVTIDCVNWLPTQKSKMLTFSITPNTVLATGGDTTVTCSAYRDNSQTTTPGYSMSRNITVPGFNGISNIYPTDEIYYGIYVSSPSTSAETSLTLDCALSGILSLGS